MLLDGDIRHIAILHTCLAKARASVRCVENSKVALSAWCTRRAIGLALELLVEIAQIVTAYAAELALVRLEHP